MRYVIFWTIMLTILFHYTARADSLGIKYGLGIIDGGPTTQVKTGAVRYEEESLEVYPLVLAAEVGLWTDTGKARGREGSAYTAWQVGLRPHSEHVYVKSFVGVCGITHRDSQLGGFFPEFKEDFGLGFQDRDSFVGLDLGHISSAGIWSPNKGRDLVTVEVGVRF
jgi:hypothetical protein